MPSFLARGKGARGRRGSTLGRVKAPSSEESFFGDGAYLDISELPRKL